MASLSRPQRWAAAIKAAQESSSSLENALSELQELGEEYDEWKESLPENLQDSPTASLLETLSEINHSEAAESLSSIDDYLEICESSDLPKGFGRD